LTARQYEKLTQQFTLLKFRIYATKNAKYGVSIGVNFHDLFGYGNAQKTD